MGIQSKTKQPQNFKFYIQEETGELKKNQKKKIQVNWEWEYETNIKNNNQDTKDAKEIKKFYFEIYTIGEY